MIENIISYLPINIKFLKISCSSEQQGLWEITPQSWDQPNQRPSHPSSLTEGRKLWGLDQGFSNLNVHDNHLGILLKCKF